MKGVAILPLLFSLMVASIAQGEPPAFCHGFDCPKYTLVSKKDGYEVRDYEPSKWVGTTVTASSYNQALESGFDLLTEYRNGANSAKAKIPMETPVATKMVPGPGATGERNFTVLFFVPFDEQANTPIPTNPKLAVVSLPAITAYVVSFGGYETDADLQKYTSQLVNSLSEDKVNYVKDFYFTAGYDPPFRTTGRHNEVWLLAAN